MKKRSKKITIEQLARMIKRGFDERTKDHQQTLKILNKHGATLVNQSTTLKNHTETLKDHTERLKRIEAKLEGVVYRREFEELKTRVDMLEKALVIKKGK